ncbi:MAG TPA: beta-ketoacyl synthase N-terminal-like domain-containing protein [Pirellulaceae bacterium]|jgi:3-oxoacyl-[acyl-carrier-protein] synthase II|nr:beta-ketoacyl synthase N-terminal-like domain-containing protein [Pirellulaceae bacterium]
MPGERKVVLTGLGVVSPIGIGKEEFWSSLTSGRSGIARIADFDFDGSPFAVGAEIPCFDPGQYGLPKKALKLLCDETQWAYAAANLALADAGLDAKTLPCDRTGVTLGSELLYSHLDELAGAYRASINEEGFDFGAWGEAFQKRLIPLWMLKYLPNMAAGHIAIGVNAQGPCNTIVQGEASALNAIIESAQHVIRGTADIMLAGGVGAQRNVITMAYRGHWNAAHFDGEPPETWSRPFDRTRNGFVRGEAAALIVLEEESHALARGARIIARLSGTALRYVQPGDEKAPAALERLARQAISSGGLTPEAIGVAVPDGMSLQEEDRWEALALSPVVPHAKVLALKSYLGMTGAASKALDVAAAAMTLSHGTLPGTLNVRQPDEALALCVPSEAVPFEAGRSALVIGRSLAGSAAAVTLSPYQA